MRSLTETVGKRTTVYCYAPYYRPGDIQPSLMPRWHWQIVGIGSWVGMFGSGHALTLRGARKQAARWREDR